MAQVQSLIAHLTAGKTITQLEARQVYGIERLASRVDDARKLGYAIDAQTKHDEAGKRYTQYSLVTRKSHNGKRKRAS